MTNLRSALNFGALITLSCCNAVLQIAAAPSCGGSAERGGQECGSVGVGAVAGTEPRLQGFSLDRRSGKGCTPERDMAYLVADFR